MHWWNELLQPELCRPARPMQADVLGVTWGDGSGTGTGGTVELLGFTAQRMWMGTWGPLSRQNTSNWKELETLQITLSRAVAEYRRTGHSPFLNCTLFYFTDNTVTYNCVTSGSSRSPLLHALIQQIRSAELILQCHLEVVHVPGWLMIRQGTDALSRGVWIAHHHDRVPTRVLLHEIFAPVHYHPTLLPLLCAKFPNLSLWNDTCLTHVSWDSD